MFTLNYTHTHLIEDGGVLLVYSAIFIISSSLLLVTQDAVQLTQHLYVCVCVCGVCVCGVCVWCANVYVYEYKRTSRTERWEVKWN